MERPVKVVAGVAGVGYLGEHHARIYAELPDCELAGIYDIDHDRATAVARKYGCQVFESVAELAAACSAVSVVVPTEHHHAVAVQLLEAGRHVLIEKPLCTSLAEAEDILAAAERHRCVVQVGHIEHFNPVMSYLEEAVAHPRYIVADRLAPFQPRGTDVGVVLDLMIHDIGIVLQLVKAPVARVDAVGVNVLSRTEDIANARIVFANGCVATLNASRVSFKKLREIRVFESAAYLSLDFMNQAGHLVRRENGKLVNEAIPIERDEPLQLELAAFLKSARKAEDPQVNGYLGKGALDLALQITEQVGAEALTPSR